MLLIKAVLEERFRQAKYLLNVGMDANQRDLSRKSALIYACQLSNPKMRIAFTKLLLHYGASASARDSACRNVISWLCYYGYLDVFEYILEYCDPMELGLDDSDKQGNTPLMLACASGNIELVKKLCAEMDNVGIRTYRQRRNWYGYNPLLVAFKSGNFDIATYLLKTDEDGHGSQEILRYIVANREKFQHCQETSSEVELLAKLVLDLPEEESKSLANIVFLLITSESFRFLAFRNKKRELRMQSVFRTSITDDDKTEVSNHVPQLTSSQSLRSLRSRGKGAITSLSMQHPGSAAQPSLPRLNTQGSAKDLLPMLMNLRVEQMSQSYRSSCSSSKTLDELASFSPKKPRRGKTNVMPDASRFNAREIRTRKSRGSSFHISRARGWSVLKDKIEGCGAARSASLKNAN